MTAKLVACFCLTACAAMPQSPGAVVLQHARIVGGTGRPPIENASIVFANGRITGIDIAVPPGARVIDATGKTMRPAKRSSRD